MNKNVTPCDGPEGYCPYMDGHTSRDVSCRDMCGVGVDAHCVDALAADVYADADAYTDETLTLLDSDADVLWTLDDMDDDYVQAFLRWEAEQEQAEALESLRAAWLAEARP